MNDLVELSKEISYALRHAPWEYELELDENGWIPIEQLLDALKNNSKWKKASKADIEQMIYTSKKKRHEIHEDKIRALYGHSIPMKIIKTKSVPPNILYHGTSHKAVNNIMKIGLHPQKRQYVHLSADIETAMDVGQRRDSNPVILLVDSKMAYEDGVDFYFGNEKVWLSDAISIKYIRIKEE